MATDSDLKVPAGVDVLQAMSAAVDAEVGFTIPKLQPNILLSNGACGRCDVGLITTKPAVRIYWLNKFNAKRPFSSICVVSEDEL